MSRIFTRRAGALLASTAVMTGLAAMTSAPAQAEYKGCQRTQPLAQNGLRILNLSIAGVPGPSCTSPATDIATCGAFACDITANATAAATNGAGVKLAVEQQTTTGGWVRAFATDLSDFDRQCTAGGTLAKTLLGTRVRCVTSTLSSRVTTGTESGFLAAYRVRCTWKIPGYLSEFDLAMGCNLNVVRSAPTD